MCSFYSGIVKFNKFSVTTTSHAIEREPISCNYGDVPYVSTVLLPYAPAYTVYDFRYHLEIIYSSKNMT